MIRAPLRKLFLSDIFITFSAICLNLAYTDNRKLNIKLHHTIHFTTSEITNHQLKEDRVKTQQCKFCHQ